MEIQVSENSKELSVYLPYPAWVLYSCNYWLN